MGQENNSNTKRHKQGLPTRSRRPSSSIDEDRPLDPLALLAEEDLPEDTSDESFHDLQLEEAVPASPQPEPRSTMTAQPPGRANFMKERSSIVGLPVVPFNQAKLADVCQYLDYLQDFLNSVTHEVPHNEFFIMLSQS